MIRRSAHASLRLLSHNLTAPTTSRTTTTRLPSTLQPHHHHRLHQQQRYLATFQVVVPNLGDSITEGTIAELTKGKGDDVATDDVIARLETDKVSIDVRSTGSGKISAVNVKQGDTVHVGDVLFEGDDAGGGGSAPKPATASKDKKETSDTPPQKQQPDQQQSERQQPQQAAPTKTQAIDRAHTQQQSHDASEDGAQPHRAHHPLIQFRYGRRSSHLTAPAQPSDARQQPRQVPASSLGGAQQQQQQQGAGQSGGGGGVVRGMQPDAYFNLQDFAGGNEKAAAARLGLPVVYRRKVWSEAEQEAVMMGGAPAYVPKSLQKEKEKAAAAGKKK